MQEESYDDAFELLVVALFLLIGLTSLIQYTKWQTVTLYDDQGYDKVKLDISEEAPRISEMTVTAAQAAFIGFFKSNDYNSATPVLTYYYSYESPATYQSLVPDKLTPWTVTKMTHFINTSVIGHLRNSGTYTVRLQKVGTEEQYQWVIKQ